MFEPAVKSKFDDLSMGVRIGEIGEIKADILKFLVQKATIKTTFIFGLRQEDTH